MDKITVGSLFDGIGGFPYAASFLGIRPLWASEIIPECVSVTKRHFPEMEHMGDITRLHGGKIPPVDIVTFGSPCQGLSMAGLRQGLADERSGLFTEAIRIIYEMKEATHGKYPKFALWENVPGALSSVGGRDYQAVLEAFTKTKVPMPDSGCWANAGMVRSGGIDLAWCIYDAQYFGTAQQRRRVFLVADFGGKRAGEILFVPQSLQEHSEPGGIPGQGAAALAGGNAEKAGRGEPGSIRTGNAGDNGVYCISAKCISRRVDYGGNSTGVKREISYTMTTRDRHAVLAPRVAGNLLSSSPYGDSQLPALQNPPVEHRVRRFTPLECERLQGFPDQWTELGHDGQKWSDEKRYRMLGNSIAVPCAAYIMQGIYHVLAKGQGEEKGQLHSGTDTKKAA